MTTATTTTMTATISTTTMAQQRQRYRKRQISYVKRSWTPHGTFAPIAHSSTPAYINVKEKKRQQSNTAKTRQQQKQKKYLAKINRTRQLNSNQHTSRLTKI
jgi:hypothetical protein